MHFSACPAPGLHPGLFDDALSGLVIVRHLLSVFVQHIEKLKHLMVCTGFAMAKTLRPCFPDQTKKKKSVFR